MKYKVVCINDRNEVCEQVFDCAEAAYAYDAAKLDAGFTTMVMLVEVKHDY